MKQSKQFKCTNCIIHKYNAITIDYTSDTTSINKAMVCSNHTICNLTTIVMDHINLYMTFFEQVAFEGTEVSTLCIVGELFEGTFSFNAT